MFNCSNDVNLAESANVSAMLL